MDEKQINKEPSGSFFMSYIQLLSLFKSFGKGSGGTFFKKVPPRNHIHLVFTCGIQVLVPYRKHRHGRGIVLTISQSSAELCPRWLHRAVLFVHVGGVFLIYRADLVPVFCGELYSSGV